MVLSLAWALRLLPATAPPETAVAFVGAGGKTTAIFQLARQLPPPVLVTTSTHMGAWQAPLADQHLVLARREATGEAAWAKRRVRAIISPESAESRMPSRRENSRGLKVSGVTLVTGPAVEGNRLMGLSDSRLRWLHDISTTDRFPLLIEADGARQKALKAPGPHEPAIPPFVDLVVVLAGLSGLGKPLSETSVHRSDRFGALSGLAPTDLVSTQGLVRVLMDAQEGGLKNVPSAAKKVVLLNQADSDELMAAARGMVPQLLGSYDSVLICSLQTSTVHAVHEPVAGIVLAAGGSRRMGQPKQILDWHGQPFVRAVAETALKAGLRPVVVVTGSARERVAAAVDRLPVRLAHNESWQLGQASSIGAGLQTIPARTGGAVFLLADQPQVTFDVITALVDIHSLGLQPVVAPLVMMERRANPVLFDRVTFPDLLALQGDVGGRAIFDKYRVEYMPWHDDRLLLAVDTEADYRRLIEADTL